MLIELNGGRAVTVRPLRSTDRARYVEAVNALSARSRYLRFASPVRSLTDRTVDGLMAADGRKHVVLVALHDDVIVAVGRYVVTAPRTGELALAVADRWQRLGLGRALLDRLLTHARAAGLCRVEATTLAENHASRRLLAATGFSPRSSDGRMIDHRLNLLEHATRSSAGEPVAVTGA